jgi:hypothetical protein
MSYATVLRLEQSDLTSDGAGSFHVGTSRSYAT